MDQSVLAGIGNVYRSEVLFRQRVDPFRPGKEIRRTTWDSIWLDLVDLLPLGVATGKIVTVAEQVDEIRAELAEGRGRPADRATLLRLRASGRAVSRLRVEDPDQGGGGSEPVLVRPLPTPPLTGSPGRGSALAGSTAATSAFGGAGSSGKRPPTTPAGGMANDPQGRRRWCGIRSCGHRADVAPPCQTRQRRTGPPELPRRSPGGNSVALHESQPPPWCTDKVGSAADVACHCRSSASSPPGAPPPAPAGPASRCPGHPWRSTPLRRRRSGAPQCRRPAARAPVVSPHTPLPADAASPRPIIQQLNTTHNWIRCQPSPRTRPTTRHT